MLKSVSHTKAPKEYGQTLVNFAFCDFAFSTTTMWYIVEVYERPFFNVTSIVADYHIVIVLHPLYKILTTLFPPLDYVIECFVAFNYYFLFYHVPNSTQLVQMLLRIGQNIV